jgi:GDSL-like lipase/acylhydrolase family protein/salicyl acyltransferaes SsfX3-like protein
MKTIQLTDDFFEGAVSVEHIGNGLKPWRVDYRLRDLFPSPDEALLGRMECTSGVRLRFSTDSSKIILNVPQIEEGTRTFDLVIDNQLLHTVELDSECTSASFDNIPTGEKVIEIWLPQQHSTEIISLEVNDDSDAVVVPDNRLKWVTYGSSISQCAAAHSPSRIWSATASRIHDLNLTSLGYGGNCHLEPMVARMIRDLSADIITLKLGINVQGGLSLNPRTFKAAVIGMIQIIREKHPSTPIGVISPIISPQREEVDNAVGLSLTKMRIEIEDAVDRIKKTDNDENLFYFDGLKIFGEPLLGPRLPDNLHPDGDGYEILGKNVAEQVLPVLIKKYGKEKGK